MALFLLLTPSRMAITARGVTYPTSDMPTLLTSIAPDNATAGTIVSWLVWTDPPLPGHEVTLTVTDLDNDTMIDRDTVFLRTVNECGSLVRSVDTTGFLEHTYEFRANMTVDHMTIESRRFLDLSVHMPELYLTAWVTPYTAIVGDTVNLTIWELNWPYEDVDVVCNVTLSNSTHALWTITDYLIPASNGNRLLRIDTTGYPTGSFTIGVNGTSSIGDDTATSGFTLQNLLVEVQDYQYYLGDLANITIRSLPTVSQVGLSIWFVDYTPVSENVSLTNGEASRYYNTSYWLPNTYTVTANATIDGYEEDTDFFWLDVFSVDADTDFYSVVVGRNVSLLIDTTPQQAYALFNFTVTNSTWHSVWTYGPATLNASGAATVLMLTADLPVGSYYVDVVVNNTQYAVEGYAYFDVYTPTFNIDAMFDLTHSGYVMPLLSVSTDPGQTTANLTLYLRSGGFTYYQFTKQDGNCSAYPYLVPLPGIPNGTYIIDVTITSAAGTNATTEFLFYTHGFDGDGDGLSDTEEATDTTDARNPDTDGDCWFDGMEVFHSSNPSPLYTIEWSGNTYPAFLDSDSYVTDFDFNQSIKTLSFNVTGETGTSGFVNITFPTQLLGSPYICLLNGSQITPVVTYNATHTSLYLAYTHSKNTIEIIGTTVIPELTSILVTLTLLALLTLLYVRTFKRTPP